MHVCTYDVLFVCFFVFCCLHVCMYLVTSCFWTYSISILHLGLNWCNNCCKTYEERANGHSIVGNVTDNPIHNM